MIKRKLIIHLFLICSLTAYAQDFDAHWIQAPQEGAFPSIAAPSGQSLLPAIIGGATISPATLGGADASPATVLSCIQFRRTFLTFAQPQDAFVTVTSTGCFRLYVNQCNVGTAAFYPPSRLTFDVTDYLRPDTNVVAILYAPIPSPLSSSATAPVSLSSSATAPSSLSSSATAPSPSATALAFSTSEPPSQRQLSVTLYGHAHDGHPFAFVSDTTWRCRPASSALAITVPSSSSSALAITVPSSPSSALAITVPSSSSSALAITVPSSPSSALAITVPSSPSSALAITVPSSPSSALAITVPSSPSTALAITVPLSPLSERIDGRLHDPDWNAATVDASSWRPVITCPPLSSPEQATAPAFSTSGPFPFSPSALLATQPTNRFQGHYPAPRTVDVLSPDSVVQHGDTLTAYFPRPFTGRVRLTLRKARRGERISFGPHVYICNGRLDEQASPFFVLTRQRVVRITGDRTFRPSHVVNIEGLVTEP